MDKLFDGPFGSGYPSKDAERKRADTKKLKEMNAVTKRRLVDVLPKLDTVLVSDVFQRKNVFDYILQHGTNIELIELLKN